MNFSIRLYPTTILLALMLSAGIAPAQEAEPKPTTAGGLWSGTVRGSTTTIVHAGMAASISGTVAIRPSTRGAMGVSQFEVRVSAAREMEQMDWGISLGRCGSRLILQNTTAQLPPITLRSGGAGELNQELPMVLTPGSSYQLVLFVGGRNEQNIVACANLKYDAKGK